MHEANEQRADWAENALDTFTRQTYGGRAFNELPTDPAGPEYGDDYTAIMDLMSDLLHVAVRKGFDQTKLLQRAVATFDYENAPDYEGD
jgi:hypothetical protein